MARAPARRPPTPWTPTAGAWAERGPALVLVTDGGSRCGSPGRATPSCTGGPRRWPSSTPWAPATRWPPACSAGLLEAGVTDRAALEALPDEDLLRLVDDAALVAALNCTRVGADPPTRAEVAAARAER